MIKEFFKFYGTADKRSDKGNDFFPFLFNSWWEQNKAKLNCHCETNFFLKFPGRRRAFVLNSKFYCHLSPRNLQFYKSVWESLFLLSPQIMPLWRISFLWKHSNPQMEKTPNLYLWIWTDNQLILFDWASLKICL